MPILCIFSLAVVLRLIYIVDYVNTEAYPLVVNSDAESYYIWAKDIACGNILGSKAFMKWPLYAYFLALLLKVFAGNLSLLYLFQFVLGAINCVLIYLIAKRIFNRAVAYLSGLFCAWYGLFIFYEGLLIYTSLSLFFNSLLFLFILRIQNNIDKKRLFLLGIFLGICALIQANIIIFGVLATAWIIWYNERSKSKRIVFNFLCFVLGLFIVIGLVTLRNYLVEKDFVLISGNTGINFYLGNSDAARGPFSSQFFTSNQEAMFRESKAITKIALGKEPKTSEVSRFWFNKAIEFIKDNPSAYLKLLFRKIIFLFSPHEPVHDHEYRFIINKIRIFKILFLDLRFILPFTFMGILLNLKRLRDTLLLYLALLSLSFSIILFFVATRYRVVIVPFLIIFAASGIFSFWEALNKKKYLIFGMLALMFMLFFILFNYKIANRIKSVRYISQSPEVLHYHLRKAVIYEERAEYEQALRELRLAESISPGNRHVVFSFGSVYGHMKNFKLAEEKFKEAIRIFPFYVDAYYDLGFLYNQQQRFDEAIRVLEEAVFLDTEDAAAHFELGKAYKLSGYFKKAKQEFELALKKINCWRTEERDLINKELVKLQK